MFSPNQIKDMDHTSPFLLSFEQVRIDGIDHGSAEILITYDAEGRAVFRFKNFFSTGVGLDSDVQLKYRADSATVPIFITKCRYSSNIEDYTVEARLTREPLVLMEKPTSDRFEAVLLGAPRFLSKNIPLVDSSGTKFELRPPKTEEGEKCVIHSDLALKAGTPIKPLGTLLNFLTFVKGTHCGLGNLFAFDKGDQLAFRLLGFTPVDLGKRETNWFDIEIQSSLPEIFLLFSKASENELTRKALGQTIDFYRASNASRNVSIEMSIIAAQSALEAIVNFILEHRAGWSKSMMSNRSIEFSDKNRAAALHFGIDNNLLSQSPELAKFSKAKNNIDIFDIISRFRNKLVHQNIKEPPTGIQLVETWLIAQWLVEILIFGVIGYRGKIIDRRIYSGWRGTTCQVPLSLLR